MFSISHKMKLIACMILVCFIFLIEAGKIPDDNFEKSNDNVIADDTKNDRGIQRRKRHSRYNSMDRNMDYRYIVEDHDDKQTIELKTEVRILRELFVSRPPVETKVMVLPVYFPSCGNNVSNDLETNLVSKFGDTNKDVYEHERIWSSNLDEYKGNRPISLNPHRPSRPFPKQPAVDRGTTQSETTTKTPAVALEICKTSILICCEKKGIERENCFSRYNCPKVYATKLACSQVIIDTIVRDFIAAYAPDNM